MNRTSVIHCENCGVPATVDASGIRYCLECDLYVCVPCWDTARGRCPNCVRSTTRQPRRDASLHTARRADRRLREAARHANTIAQIDASSDDGKARDDLDCLTVKATTARKTGLRALARGKRSGHVRSLAERIGRHSTEAEAVLARAGAALADSLPVGAQDLRRAPVARARAALTLPSFLRGSRAVAPAVMAFAAVVVAAVIVPVWLLGPEGHQSPLEGILAGNDSADPASVPSPGPSSGDGPVGPGAPAGTLLTVDFNAGRMGAGLGTGWMQTSGGEDAVALAPFPTAVDRSARLRSIDVAGAEACRPVAPTTVRITRLFVDVLLSETTTAFVIARDASRSVELRVSLRASDSTFTLDGGSPLAMGGRLPVGEWLRTEITARDGQTLWRVDGGSSGIVIEETIDVGALTAIDEVCFAVSTDSTGPAHFDNLSVEISEEG